MTNPLTPEYLAELEAAIARATKEHSLSAGVTFSYAPNPDDLDEIIKAARTFHAIAPLLMEVIEARGRATNKELFVYDHRRDDGGFWVGVDHPELGELSIASFRYGCDEAEEQGGTLYGNAGFFVISANNIAKIEKVLRDAPKESDDERA